MYYADVVNDIIVIRDLYARYTLDYAPTGTVYAYCAYRALIPVAATASCPQEWLPRYLGVTPVLLGG